MLASPIVHSFVQKFPSGDKIYQTLTFVVFRHESSQEGLRSRRAGLPLHLPFSVRVGHPLSKVRRARRIREGVLRHLRGGYTDRCELGQDLCSEPAPAEPEDSTELRSETVCGVRRAAELGEASTEEDQEQRELQGGGAEGHNRESAGNGGQVRPPVRHDHHKHGHGPRV